MSASVPHTSHLQPSPRPAPVIELAEFFARLPEARERTLRELAAFDDDDRRKAAPGSVE